MPDDDLNLPETGADTAMPPGEAEAPQAAAEGAHATQPADDAVEAAGATPADAGGSQPRTAPADGDSGASVDAAPADAAPADSPAGVEPDVAADAPQPEAVRAPQIAELSPAQCAAKLAELFPALFGPAPKPLKLKIQADIQQRAPGVFTRRSLSNFLHRHTTSNAYLSALARSEHRHDLDGQPAGELAAEHREAAATEIARRRGVHEARRAAERAAARAAEAEQRERDAAEHEARRDRATLLRAFETTTLTPANFCALKGIAEADLQARLELARRERAERPPMPPRDGWRGDRGDRGDRGEGPGRHGGRPHGAAAEGERRGPRPEGAGGRSASGPRGDGPRGPRHDGPRGPAAGGERHAPGGPEGAGRGPRPGGNRDHGPRPQGGSPGQPRPEARGERGPRPEGGQPGAARGGPDERERPPRDPGQPRPPRDDAHRAPPEPRPAAEVAPVDSADAPHVVPDATPPQG